MSQPTSEASPIDVAVLGPLEVRRDGRVLDLGGSKQRMLVAALALEANRDVSDTQLLDILWGDEPPEGATDALRVHIHRLRRTIESSVDGAHSRSELLVRRPTGYSLVIDAEQLDVARFRALVNAARTTGGGIRSADGALRRGPGSPAGSSLC